MNNDINTVAPPPLLAESSTLRNQTDSQSKTKIADIAELLKSSASSIENPEPKIDLEKELEILKET